MEASERGIASGLEPSIVGGEHMVPAARLSQRSVPPRRAVAFRAWPEPFTTPSSHSDGRRQATETGPDRHDAPRLAALGLRRIPSLTSVHADLVAKPGGRFGTAEPGPCVPRTRQLRNDSLQRSGVGARSRVGRGSSTWAPTERTRSTTRNAVARNAVDRLYDGSR